MIIKTKFSNGDVVYGVGYPRRPGDIFPIGPMTVGRVRVEITDSPGVEGETMFDNYKPQSGREETYMCVETGIGTGTIHSDYELFATREESEAHCKKTNDGKKK